MKSHGLQPLPEKLPVMDLDATKPYRSSMSKAVVIDTFHYRQVLQLAKTIAASFAINEPMTRDINPSKEPQVNLRNIKHYHPYGEDEFGEWTKENILYWVIRLFILTNPADPIERIGMNKVLLTHSLAILNDAGEMIGGAFNLPLSLSDVEQAPRANDPFMDAAYSFFQPIHHLLISQDAEALQYLNEKFPHFKTAFNSGKAVIFFMIARSPLLPTEDAFELVAATIERFKELSYEYVVTAAANQWTGADFELIGGVRVHFAHYRYEKN
jgi:hypothetical protein